VERSEMGVDSKDIENYDNLKTLEYLLITSDFTFQKMIIYPIW